MMSKERPILFSDEMVRAILKGRKTQTRRVIKGIGHDLLNMMSEDIVTGNPNSELLDLIYGPSTDDDGKRVHDQWLVRCTECPEEGVLTMGQGYGKPGDRLWVREAFQGPLVPYEQAQDFYKHREPFESSQYCEYRADGGPSPEFINADDDTCYGWRPSIHMPRWASRITLEITDEPVTSGRVKKIMGDLEEIGRVRGVERMKASGESNREIARRLGVSEKAIRKQLRAIDLSLTISINLGFLKVGLTIKRRTD